MVEKFQIILNRILEEKNEVTLFALLKMDEFTDKWSILVCANWLDENSFSYLSNLLKSVLNEEESKTIARIGIFSEDDHLIDLLLNYKTGSRIQEQKVNGNLIHDGYIIYSNRIIGS